MAHKAIDDESPERAEKAPRKPGGPERPAAVRRGQVLAASLTALVLLLALGGWLLYGALNRTLTSPADPGEIGALDARLVKIEAAARPIAEAFASETATGVIDVTAYRTRIASFRNLVDSTNDLQATSPDALEVRDLIVTGGSEVAAGMSAALDALVSNEPSAALPAATQIDEGLSNLDDARTKIDKLLGRVGPASGTT